MYIHNNYIDYYHNTVSTEYTRSVFQKLGGGWRQF